MGSSRIPRKANSGGKFHKDIHPGPLCFFHDHSIGSKDGLIPRYADTHACVKCVAGLTEGRISLDVHKIHRMWRREFLTFWSFVNIGDPQDCWEWEGYIRPTDGWAVYGFPRFWSKGRVYSVSRIAAWLSWGDIGKLRFNRLCDNPRCCNPTHIRVLDVAHYWHGSHITSSLEFSSHKLLSETQHFIETANEVSPRMMEKLNAVNAEWIKARLEIPLGGSELSTESHTLRVGPPDDDEDDPDDDDG